MTQLTNNHAVFKILESQPDRVFTNKEIQTELTNNFLNSVVLQQGHVRGKLTEKNVDFARVKNAVIILIRQKRAKMVGTGYQYNDISVTEENKFLVPSSHRIFFIEGENFFVSNKEFNKKILIEFKKMIEEKWSDFRLVASGSTSDVIYGISGEELHELTYKEPYLSKRKIASSGFSAVEYLCYFDGLLYCIDLFGFFYSYDISNYKVTLLRNEAFDNVKGLCASESKVFILHSN
eukprot:gene6663-10828_t